MSQLEDKAINYKELSNALKYTKKYIDKNSSSTIEKVADWTTNVTTNGLVAGTDLTGMDALEILKAITKKYIESSATVTWSQENTIIENGTSFNLDISVSNITVGDGTPTKILLYQDDTLIEELSITDLTSTLSFTTISNIDIDTSFKIILEDSNNISSTLSTKSYTFIYPTYVGIVNNGNVNETNILNLTKLARDKTIITQSFTTSGSQTIVFASIWQLSSIVNQNNYEVISNFTLDNITINNINYYVYSLSNVNLEDFKYTFKY